MAGRRMPHNNRVSSSSALRTNDIWSKTIGHNPYKNEDDDENDEAKTDQAAGLLLLAKMTNVSGSETRGGCSKCGMMGHLRFQCRNTIQLATTQANDDSSSSSSSDDEEEVKEELTPSENWGTKLDALKGTGNGSRGNVDKGRSPERRRDDDRNRGRSPERRRDYDRSTGRSPEGRRDDDRNRERSPERRRDDDRSRSNERRSAKREDDRSRSRDRADQKKKSKKDDKKRSDNKDKKRKEKEKKKKSSSSKNDHKSRKSREN